MKSAPQIIIRVIFELHFRERKRVNSIQDRVSLFAGNLFHAVMAEGLSGIGKDRLMVFEQVEFDVGEVCISRLEDDLATGIGRCLKRWAFSANPSHSSSLQHPSSALSPENAQRREAFGRRQQSVTAVITTPGGLSKAVAAALQETADWSEFLAALRENHALRCRLADEVSPKLLRRLTVALAPAEGEWIAGWAEEMIRLHEQQPFLPINVHVFRRVFWESIFFELAGRQLAGLNQRSLVQSVLRRLARRYSRAHSEVAASLALALKQRPPRSPIRELLEHAARELMALPSSDLESPESSLAFLDAGQIDPVSGGASRRIDDLATFLELGVLPWSLVAQGPETELLDLLATAPEEICAAVRGLNVAEAVRKRLCSQFKEDSTRRLLVALAPSAAHWMISYMHELRRIHAQKPLFPMRNRQFGQELWELCFEYLGQRKWQNFTPASFLQFLLTRLAVRRKIGYEILLVEVALRRGEESRLEPSSVLESSGSLSAMLIALVDETILDLAGVEAEVPRFLIKPQYRHCYSDLDVLGHWLSWRKLPEWSHATDPEDTGRRLGSILRGLPPEIKTYAQTSMHGSVRPEAKGLERLPALSAIEQIGRWLSFGIWPETIAVADQAQLEAWLANQNDADWLKALEATGTQEPVIARISRQLPAPLQERITRLLSGNAAELTFDYLRCLDAAGRRVAPVATQVWVEHLRKYTLIYLLRASSISGRRAVSVTDLARSTMLALALICRVSYERLLDAVELESRRDDEVQDLCQSLREQLETEESDISGIEPAAIIASNAKLARSIEVHDLVLQYLQHGSLPESAFAISLSSLRRAAAQLQAAEIHKIATACYAEGALDLEKARRIAAFFSKENFACFTGICLASRALVDELEEVAVELASRLSTPVRPLAVAARTFLLRLMRAARSQKAEENILKTGLPYLVQEIARLTGVLPDLVGRELGTIVKNKEILAKALAKDFLKQETDDGRIRGPIFVRGEPFLLSRANSHSVSANELDINEAQDGKVSSFGKEQSGSKEIDSQRPSFERPTNGWGEGVQHKIAALSHFLRKGQLPWWGENLAHEPCREWVSAALAQSPRLLLDTLRPLSVQPKALQRLTRYLAQNELEEIVRTAAPECGGLLLLYIYAGAEFESRNAAGVARQSTTRSVHWHECLSHLLDGHPTRYSPLEILQELSIRVSRRLELSQERYAASLLQIVHERRRAGKADDALAGTLEQLLPPNSPGTDSTTEAVLAAAPAAARGKKTALEYEPAKAEVTHGQDEVCGNKSLVSRDASPNKLAGKNSRSGFSSNEFTPLDVVVEIGPGSDPLQRLDYLLRYGALPETEGSVEQKLTAQVMEDIGKRPIQYRRYLLEVAGHEIERKRMARLLPVPLLGRLWPLLLPADHDNAVLYMDVLGEAASIASTGAIAEGFREIVVEQLFHAIAALQHRRWDATVFFRSAVERLSESLALRPAVLMRRVRAIAESKRDDIQKRLKAVIERVELETATMPRLRTHNPLPLEKEQRHEPARISRRMPEGEPFYICNAGLVLLWPFLQQYFRRLDLTDEKNAFRTEHTQSRAIHLMQYLVTSSLQAPEHDLLLNKIVAGAMLEQPLETPAPLIEAEEALSNQLLRGVLQNWEKLKNTSIQGLRESFLMREGKLLLQDDAWSLTVSAKGYDMLLDSLAWRLSPVRLPFMKTVLHVKWR